MVRDPTARVVSRPPDSHGESGHDGLRRSTRHVPQGAVVCQPVAAPPDSIHPHRSPPWHRLRRCLSSATASSMSVQCTDAPSRTSSTTAIAAATTEVAVDTTASMVELALAFVNVAVCAGLYMDESWCESVSRVVQQSVLDLRHRGDNVACLCCFIAPYALAGGPCCLWSIVEEPRVDYLVADAPDEQAAVVRADGHEARVVTSEGGVGDDEAVAAQHALPRALGQARQVVDAQLAGVGRGVHERARVRLGQRVHMLVRPRGVVPHALRLPRVHARVRGPLGVA